MLLCLAGCKDEEVTIPAPAVEPGTQTTPAAPAGLSPVATPTRQKPDPAYTLKNRPAGDWAGHWRMKDAGKYDHRYLIITNKLTGGLLLDEQEDALSKMVEYIPEGDKLLVDKTKVMYYEGDELLTDETRERLPIELTGDPASNSLTLNDLESGKSATYIKTSDPITGIVLNNVDRFEALGAASSASADLMKQTGDPSEKYKKAELRRILEKYFDSFPLIENGSYQKLTMNPDKAGFDAFRFKTPEAGHNWDLFWEFVLDSSTAVNSWYIAPRTGTMEGFTGYENQSNVKIDGLQLPPKNLQIKQSLTGGKLKPNEEYLIWFGNLNSWREPYDLFVRVRLLPAE